MTAESIPKPDSLHGTEQPRSRTWHMRASKVVSYEVVLLTGLLDPSQPALAAACSPDGGGPGRQLIVIDSTVYALYGRRIGAYFAARGIEHEFCVVEAHESVKSMDTVFEIVASMDAFGVPRRREPVLAVGAAYSPTWSVSPPACTGGRPPTFGCPPPLSAWSTRP